MPRDRGAIVKGPSHDGLSRWRTDPQHTGHRHAGQCHTGRPGRLSRFRRRTRRHAERGVRARRLELDRPRDPGQGGLVHPGQPGRPGLLDPAGRPRPGSRHALLGLSGRLGGPARGLQRAADAVLPAGRLQPDVPAGPGHVPASGHAARGRLRRRDTRAGPVRRSSPDLRRPREPDAGGTPRATPRWMASACGFPAVRSAIRAGSC
jgi:hypothetical protein